MFTMLQVRKFLQNWRGEKITSIWQLGKGITVVTAVVILLAVTIRIPKVSWKMPRNISYLTCSDVLLSIVLAVTESKIPAITCWKVVSCPDMSCSSVIIVSLSIDFSLDTGTSTWTLLYLTPSVSKDAS